MEACDWGWQATRLQSNVKCSSDIMSQILWKCKKDPWMSQEKRQKADEKAEKNVLWGEAENLGLV